MEQPLHLLDVGHVVLDVHAPDFQGCLDALTGYLAQHEALDAVRCRLLTEALRDRERLATTSIGRGVAVPHAYVEGVPRVMLLFARLKPPVAHETQDEQPIDLVFMLVGPEEAQAGHLPLLARLVRLLHDQRFLAELRGAATPEAVLRALREVERRHA
jgi:PTS system nitrogen regulatory IIA component